MMQFENPRYQRALEDNFAEAHPLYLNPHFRCYNLDCYTCQGLEMAREWSERCYRATHQECDIEESIRKYEILYFNFSILKVLTYIFRTLHHWKSFDELDTSQ